MKVWRRLQNLGAVGLKNSVYVLPNNDRAREDFEWLLREIAEGGGEGWMCEAKLVDGLSDEQVEVLFVFARDAEYAQIARDARSLLDTRPRGRAGVSGGVAELRAQLKQLRRRLAAAAALDHFEAPGRSAAEAVVAQLEARVTGPVREVGATGSDRPPLRGTTGRTWVTRRGVHVDRMASAWLIRRFIDPEARFKFVSASRYRPQSGELRFDMFEAEFTHEGDRCTFEVLLDAAVLRNPALRRIAEVVHDIDLNDEKYGHDDRPGIERLIGGITLTHDNDEERLARGATVFDALYASYRRRRI